MKAIILLTVFILSTSAFSATKVGLVNIQKIIGQIKEGQAVNKTLEKSFKSKQKSIKKDEASIRKLQEQLQKQSKVLSDSAKAKKFAEVQKKVAAARAQTQKFQKEIQKQEANLKKPILEKLKKVIDKISKQEKVDLTFEISSSPVVYAAEKVDLNDLVIKAYDKEHSK